MKYGFSALLRSLAFCLLLLAFPVSFLGQNSVPKTPLTGFELPPYGTQNWQVYWDYNFGLLDNYLGGVDPLAHGVLLNTPGSQPTCTSAIRGLIWTLEGSSDVMEQCQLISGSTYGWVAAGGAGSVWYTGSGAPSTFYQNGDFYLQITTGTCNFYEQVSGSWVLLGSCEGTPGEGVPVGGTTGQVLAKNSNNNYDTVWVAQPSATWGSINGTLSNQTDLITALNAKVATSTTVNGQPLSGNVTITASTLGLATVATSGSYPDLINKPTIPAGPPYTESQITNLTTDLAAKVPTSTTVNGHPLSSNVTVTPGDVGNTTAQWNANKINGSTPATVATSGSYTDLSNQPTIPTTTATPGQVLTNASSTVSGGMNIVDPNLTAGGDIGSKITSLSASSTCTSTPGCVILLNPNQSYSFSTGILVGADNQTIDCNFSQLHYTGTGTAVDTNNHTNVILRNCESFSTSTTGVMWKVWGKRIWLDHIVEDGAPGTGTRTLWITGNATASTASHEVFLTNDAFLNATGQSVYIDHVIDLNAAFIVNIGASGNTTATMLTIDSGTSGVQWFGSQTTWTGLHGLVITNTAGGTSGYNKYPTYLEMYGIESDTCSGGDCVVFDASLGTGDLASRFWSLWAGGAGIGAGGTVVTSTANGVAIHGGSGIQFIAPVVRANANNNWLFDNSNVRFVNITDFITDAGNLANNSDAHGFYITATTLQNLHIVNGICGNILDSGGHQGYCIKTVSGNYAGGIFAFIDASGNSVAPYLIQDTSTQTTIESINSVAAGPSAWFDFPNGLKAGAAVSAPVVTVTGLGGAAGTLLCENSSKQIVDTGCASGGGSMVYPPLGVAVSSGSGWSSSLTVGTGANNLVQLDGSAHLPSVNGSALTGLTYSQLSGTPTIPTSANWPNAGSCPTGQFEIQSTNGAAPTCAQVQYSQVGGTPASLPPSGAAGGKLSGTYPNPGVNLASGDIPNNAANTTGTAGGLSANITESQVTSLPSDLAGKLSSSTYNPDWNAVSGAAMILNKPAIPAPANSTPVMDGTGTPGSLTTYSRADHQHPTDTSRAADTAVVHNTGNESVGGVKTFGSSPSVPTPVNPGDAATKNYVDTHAGLPDITDVSGVSVTIGVPTVLGVGPTQISGTAQSGTSVTVPLTLCNGGPCDFSFFLGSDDQLHCQLSTALGGGSCAPSGGASGVSSFNSRTGAVAPTSGDYSFSQISGAATLAQFPSAGAGTILGNSTGSSGAPSYQNTFLTVLSGDLSSPGTGRTWFNTAIGHPRHYDGVNNQSVAVLSELVAHSEYAAGWAFGQNALSEIQGTPASGQQKQNVIACIGDSITSGYADGKSWCTAMAGVLHELYGNAGPGWVSAQAAASVGFTGWDNVHNPAPDGCGATASNPTHWTQETNGSGKSIYSPDDTDIYDSTSGDTVTITCPNVNGNSTSGGGFVIYYPTCVSGCGSFTYAIDSNSSQGTINENTGTLGYATQLVDTLDGTNPIAEGNHSLKLTTASTSPTYFLGADAQDQAASLSNGYGVRVEKLASNSETAANRNLNTNFGAQLWNATNCQGSTPASNNLCINSTLVSYGTNERNTGVSPPTAQVAWTALHNTLAAANANSDEGWISQQDNNQTCGGTCAYTTQAYSDALLDSTTAWTTTTPSRPIHFFNVNNIIGNETVGNNRYLYYDGIHLSDEAKQFVGEQIAQSVIKAYPRLKARTRLGNGPVTFNGMNSSSSPALFELAKESASGWTTASTSDTGIPLSACVDNCKASAMGEFSGGGITPLYMDGSSTVGHYVQASVTTGGYGHDSGYTTNSPPPLPGSGCQEYLGIVTGAASGSGKIGYLNTSSPFLVCAAGASPGGYGWTMVSQTASLNPVLASSFSVPGSGGQVGTWFYNSGITSPTITLPSSLSGITTGGCIRISNLSGSGTVTVATTLAIDGSTNSRTIAVNTPAVEICSDGSAFISGSVNTNSILNVNKVVASGSAGLSAPGGSVTGQTLAITSKCTAAGSAASTSLVACGAATAGIFSCDHAASGGACVISTTGVTAASNAILITPTAATEVGTALGVTCDTAATQASTPLVTDVTPTTSFTVALGTIASGKAACYSFAIF